jgi:hypothetical protein
MEHVAAYRMRVKNVCPHFPWDYDPQRHGRVLVSPPIRSAERPPALTVIVHKVFRLRGFTDEVAETIASFYAASYQGHIQAQISGTIPSRRWCGGDQGTGLFSRRESIWILTTLVHSSWDGLRHERFHAPLDAPITSSMDRFGYRNLAFIRFRSPSRTMNPSR